MVAKAAEEVAALLEDAVRLRLVADVPIGLLLSGGVDSTALLAVMHIDQEEVRVYGTLETPRFQPQPPIDPGRRRFRSRKCSTRLPWRPPPIRWEAALADKGGYLTTSPRWPKNFRASIGSNCRTRRKGAARPTPVPPVRSPSATPEAGLRPFRWCVCCSEPELSTSATRFWV